MLWGVNEQFVFFLRRFIESRVRPALFGSPWTDERARAELEEIVEEILCKVLQQIWNRNLGAVLYGRSKPRSLYKLVDKIRWTTTGRLLRKLPRTIDPNLFYEGDEDDD